MPHSLSSVAAGALSALICLATCAAEPGGQPAQPDVGNFVRALWLIQSFGTLEAASPSHDERTKAVLAKAIGKDGVLSLPGVKEIMDPKTFAHLAGGDSRLDAMDVRRALAGCTVPSRGRLLPGVVAHVQALTTTFDRIDAQHLAIGEQLADWVVDHYDAGRPLDVVFVCTGNSRRSVLASTMGNVAAAYYGLTEIRCHSGGTAPTAVNQRTVATLRAIGLEIEATGAEAPPGPAGDANPVYLLRWGHPGDTHEPPMETTEFSKRYDDESNPRAGFAALMVCGGADAACPLVKGAALRISMPYLDPKVYDDGEFEAAKYAERRDDLGRLMLAVMSQVRRRLDGGKNHGHD
ncbi:MAG TPA: hypothetical protein VMV69_10705 [Pirellulales bacterium]|nr:hypothetical protein [Pirellulales bacterium]